MEPLIVTASICGREKTKADSPYFPATTDEVIADGIKSFKAGVPQLHIHARDKEGNPTYDPGVFREILDAFAENCPGAVLQISAGGTYAQPNELLIPLLKLRPDVATLSMQKEEKDNLYLLGLFEAHGVLPIIECFSLDNARAACRLIQNGHIKAPVRMEILLDEKDGRSFHAMATQFLETYQILSAAEGIAWSFGRGARFDLALQAMAATLGGHLRVGLEDKVVANDGTYIKESADLVCAAMDIAVKMGRTLADIPTARKILGIPG